MTAQVLITMDDLEAAVRTNASFEKAGYSTVLASPLDDAAGILRDSEFDLVILTGAFPEPTTKSLISLARARSILLLGLLETATPEPSAFAAEVGLNRYLLKPADPAEVVATAIQMMDRRRLQRRVGIHGESAAIHEVLVKIEQMAPVSSTVLIEGESGTGKELVAHAIHELSPRRDGPFIAVNCAALPETLLGSELCGHEKGSFTGAAERRLGRFELADGGTLFLDEVGEMPLSTQVKLLRVLENRAFFRVGGTESIRVDVRVITATNRSLREQVSLGEFRDDLYYRLNVLSVYMAPLRERKGDIPELIRLFIRELSDTHGKTFSGITPGAMEILVNAHWPGNVRELRNLIESMVVLAPGNEIGASDIPAAVREGGARLLPVRVPQQTQQVQGNELEFIFRSLVELKLQVEELRRRVDEKPDQVHAIDIGRTAPVEFEEIIPVGGVELSGEEELVEKQETVIFQPGMKMADVERAAIEATLIETKGNRRKAAEKLEIGERTLYRKIREYNLD